jgi:hypothetical protein
MPSYSYLYHGLPVLSYLLSLAVPSALGASNTLNFPISELFSPLVPTKVHAIASTQNPTRYPQYTTTDTGKWIYFDADLWTTGFFPATLYALAERASLCHGEGKGQWDKQEWLDLGRGWSTGELRLTAGNHAQHDQGFLSFPFVEELKVNSHNETAAETINQFATILANRYSPVVGATRSWDHDIVDPTDWPVIIDNIMNLELLMVSAELTNNRTLETIARSTANKIMQNHFREDGSTYHVVTYNRDSGNVVRRYTVQGYSNSR